MSSLVWGDLTFTWHTHHCREKNGRKLDTMKGGIREWMGKMLDAASSSNINRCFIIIIRASLSGK